MPTSSQAQKITNWVSERAKNESHNLRQNMFNSPNTFKTFWLLDQAETPRVS